MKLLTLSICLSNMPRRKIPLIDVIKINSKKILDIISKYEGGIDEITDGRNKYCNKKTPD